MPLPFRAYAPLQQAAMQAVQKRRPAAKRPVAPAVPGAPGVAPNTYGYESDPIYQQIKAQQQQALANANANALAGRKTSMVDYGYDPTMAGLYADPATEAAAKANPFSTLAQLSHQHDLRARNLDQTLNQGNLFYSSYRGQQLGEEGRQYLGEQAGAASALRAKLAEIAQGVLGAEQGAQGAITQGATDAYGRALDFGLRYGTYSNPVATALRKGAKPKKGKK